VQHISKRYPGVVALDDVSLDLHAGEVLCLVGENGAGKSTLVRILAGAHRADEGEILIDGAPVLPGSPAAAQGLGIGMIHQDLKLVPEMTAAENIVLGSEPTWTPARFINRQAMRKTARDALDALGESVDIDTPVKFLSIARQQLVAIARAISRRVRILILDEPTAPLTRHEIQGLFTVLKKLRQDGVGVVYISHRLEEVFEIADRVAVLRDGRLVKTAAAGELDRPSLITLMVGRDLEHEYPPFVHTPGPEILRIENLSSGKVQNATLTLHRGEVLGLAGLVGAGRTELARMIFGADRPAMGRIILDGVEIHPQSPRDAIDAGLGLLTEDRNRFGLIVEMNVRENISLSHLGVLLKGLFVNRAREREVADASVRRLRIKTPSIEQYVNTLSGGNRQKVVLARWLLTKAKVLIFDEPTNGIDVGVRFEIYRIIHELAAEGIGIMVISSDMPELLGVCDRIAVMCEGKLMGELSKEQATQEGIMDLATPDSGSLDAAG
jgi:ribose transport system ATP-binding protein